MINICQEKFVLNQLQNSSENDEIGKFWHIPLRIVEAKAPNASKYIWLRENELSKSVTEIDFENWVVLNPDATGFYRVLYDPALTTSLEVQ
ncbi:unnamed protein product, partial [Allacma fusca]